MAIVIIPNWPGMFNKNITFFKIFPRDRGIKASGSLPNACRDSYYAGTSYVDGDYSFLYCMVT